MERIFRSLHFTNVSKKYHLDSEVGICLFELFFTDDPPSDWFSGEYKVNLPDGRVQTVSYRADPVQGFVADVKYEVEI